MLDFHIDEHGLICLKGPIHQELEILGYLVDFHENGIRDPTYGKVNVTKEQADKHNKLLDQMMLDGLDKNCEIGQYGTFYFDDNKKIVTTFMGTLVSDGVTVSGVIHKTVTFSRKDKIYQGRLQKNADCFNFRRIR